MKLIEALKKVKALDVKQSDLIMKIKGLSANMSMEDTGYANPKTTVTGWLQAIQDINLEKEALLERISYTNTMTRISIEIDGRMLTKSITAWIARRSKGLAMEQSAWATLTNKGLKAALVKVQGSEDSVMNSVVLNFDPQQRDTKLAGYAAEMTQISSALEIHNATVDLLELPA
jgi:hypothetical protein